MSLIQFIKLIPEFNRISTNDKILLIRNHFGTMIIINESNHRPNEDYTISTVQNFYGTEITLTLCRCLGFLQAYWHDPILTKLLIIVRSLSSSISRNCGDMDMDRIYNDTQTIFAVENIYVELLWRYILSRLPSEKDAIKLFNKIILDLLCVVSVSFMIDSYVYSFPNEIDQMDVLMQNMWPRPNTQMA
jgi:hypothetical protein